MEPGAKECKLALCQTLVQQDKGANLKQAREMIAAAAAQGAQLVVLPEMFSCPYQPALFALYAERFPQGETFAMLAQTAQEHALTLVGGSVPEQDGALVYNTTVVYGPTGQLLGQYRKMHLFDVNVPGGPKVQESSTLTAGEKVVVVPTDFGPLGLAICYDLRFPELFRLLMMQGARIIVVPAAFTKVTGQAHWDLLIRTRAVDNQVFMAVVSPARNPQASYVTYGHSMVADPWGTVVAQAGAGEELLLATCNLEQVEKVRQELPLGQHRRTDVYTLSSMQAKEKQNH